MEKVLGREVTAFAAVVATLLLLPPHGAAVPPAAAATGLEGSCTRSCGDISIPYPFGIEPGCYHAAGFNLTCRDGGSPELFLGDGTVRVLDIFIQDSTVRISSPAVDWPGQFDIGKIPNTTWGGGLPRSGPFFLSGSVANMFLATGCSITLDWIISNSTCPINTSASECRSSHSYCEHHRDDGHGGYKCQCSEGYGGNAYVAGGCQDIDECKYPGTYYCYGHCENTPGSFICECINGYTGNASVPNGCIDIDECDHPDAHSCYGTCENFSGTFQCLCPYGTYGNPRTRGGCKNSYTGLSIGLGVGGGTILLLLGFVPFLVRKIKLQKIKMMKQKFFNQNHGLLLQQLISRNTDIGERMIITIKELQKATDNFSRTRVVGGGGHGIVFKGILDLNVVAIKKSKIVVQREIDDFINEVAVLSQVNHRNVVKLLGCCLETEVPLLVYEFISNGTLYHHLHVEGPISLPWDDRVRIAMEIARAVSYLHSSTSMSIFHRDIKSSNILLDDNLTAKVSDFGASRYIPIDKTGVTTMVQGTIGYLDPMYYYTGRLTDKSDVFSFGVLLIEILTRKKPFVFRTDDGNGLVSYFISLLEEGKLIDIIDPQIFKEEDGEVQEVAALAAMCTKLKGEDRPAMREVEITLENLLVKKKQVPFDKTERRYGEDQALVHYLPTEHVANNATSRQYTMEEEMLLSASYPR